MLWLTVNKHWPLYLYQNNNQALIECVASIHIVGGQATNDVQLRGDGHEFERSQGHLTSAVRSSLSAVKISLKMIYIIVSHKIVW